MYLYVCMHVYIYIYLYSMYRYVGVYVNTHSQFDHYLYAYVWVDFTYETLSVRFVRLVARLTLLIVGDGLPELQNYRIAAIVLSLRT